MTFPKLFKDFHANIFLQIHVQKHFLLPDFGEPKMTSWTIDEWPDLNLKPVEKIQKFPIATSSPQTKSVRASGQVFTSPSFLLSRFFLTTTQGSHRGPVSLRHCNFVPTAVKSSQLEIQSRFDHQSGKYNDIACSLYSGFWQPLVDIIRSLLFEVAKVLSREQIKYAVFLLLQWSTNVSQVRNPVHIYYIYTIFYQMWHSQQHSSLTRPYKSFSDKHPPARSHPRSFHVDSILNFNIT